MSGDHSDCRSAGDDGSPGPYSFLLPEALSGRLRSPGGPAPVRVPDGRELVRSYFAGDGPGWRFEARLRQPENLALPHQITFANWENAAALLDDRAEWSDVRPLCDRILEPLAAISPGADVFSDWPTAEEPALDVLTLMTREHGLSTALASALLYQKRPFLFPVLDRATRLGLNVLPQPGRRELFRLAIRQLERIAGLPQNRCALDRLTAWLAANPAEAHCLALTQVRVVNLMAAAAHRIRAESDPAVPSNTSPLSAR